MAQMSESWQLGSDVYVDAAKGRRQQGAVAIGTRAGTSVMPGPT